MKSRIRTLAWVLPLLVIGAGCGEDRVDTQLPRLHTDLVLDPTGEADFLVDFGEVPLGRQARLSFELENAGSAELNLHSLGAEAPFAFLITRGRTPVGARSELRVLFEPKEETPAPQHQLITFSSNERAGGRTYSVRLLGRGVVPRLHCEPPLIDFGKLPRGTTATSTTSCTNPLTVPIEVSALPVEGIHAASFSATVPGQAGRTLLEGGDRVEIEFEVRAESLGENRASLTLQDAQLNTVARLELLAEVAPVGLAFQPASCLDFPYVQLGESLTRTLSVTNVGPDPLQIEAIELGDIGDFSVTTPLPLPIPRESETSIEVVFHPTAEGLRQVVIEVQTDRDTAIGGPFSACAKGFGGGPLLSCTPTLRDMGAAVTGLPATATFECLNAGHHGGGQPEPLFVRSVTSDASAFSASIRNKDGTRFPAPAGYPPGETFQIEVRFSPATEGFASARILVETSANHEELLVSGEGRLLPPCDFSIEPPTLHYGVVAPGEERTQSFRIHNHGEAACLIRDLKLGQSSDPAFSLEPLSSFELAGSSSLEIPVRFAPTAVRLDSRGKVNFEISNPNRRSQEVELRGNAMSRCLLVEPSPIDFGGRAPSCKPLARRFDLINVCNSPLTIRSLSISGDASVFTVVDPSLAGSVILPTRRLSLDLAFAPDEERAYLGSLDVEVEVEEHPVLPQQLHRIGLRGHGGRETQQIDEFVVEGKPKVDILWVIDNSGSMSRYQDRIANNLPSFLDYAANKNIDYQIGVTTTALIWGAYGDYCPGGVDGEENGRLFPADGSHPRILTPATIDLETHWKHNIQVGTCFALNQESALEAAYRALSPPLINNRKDPRYSTPYQDGNYGFLRPDASLSIILVSDAIDFSTASEQWYVDFFLGLKNWDRERVRVHSITGPRSGGEITDCRAAPGDRMLQVTRATNGAWMDICTPTEDQAAWSAGLAAMSEGAFSIAFSDRFTLRGRPADRNRDLAVNGDDIDLWIDGAPLPSARPGSSARAWYYEPSLNRIRFEPLFAPVAGARISIAYEIACD